MSQPPTVGLFQIALVACLIVFAIGRQFVTRPVSQRALYVVPIAVLGYGVFAFVQQPVGWAELGTLGLSVALSAVLGVARGASMRVWIDARGTAVTKGTLVTLLLWLVSILARVVLGFVTGAQAHAAPNVAELCIVAGTTIGAQVTVIWLRSLALLDPARQARSSFVA